MGCPPLAYGGDGEPKEHGGKRHNAVDSLSLRQLLPLDIACSDEESDKDTYTANSALARELASKRGTRYLPYITHSKNTPTKNADT